MWHDFNVTGDHRVCKRCGAEQHNDGIKWRPWLDPCDVRTFFGMPLIVSEHVPANEIHLRQVIYDDAGPGTKVLVHKIVGIT